MNIKPLPSQEQPVINPVTGRMTPQWYDYFRSRENIALANLSDVSKTAPTNGQILKYVSATLLWTPT